MKKYIIIWGVLFILSFVMLVIDTILYKIIFSAFISNLFIGFDVTMLVIAIIMIYKSVKKL